MAKVLTTAGVKSAQPSPNRRLEIPDAGLPGLHLVVQPSGAKSWALRYRVAGKPKKLTLGSVLLERTAPPAGEIAFGAPMTLAEARAAGRVALQAVAEGRDPAGEKRMKAKAAKIEAPAENPDTVENQGAKFVARYCKPKNKSWAEVERQFRAEINPAWGSRQVASIGKRDVLDLTDAIVERGSPVTANRVLATLKTFFGWLVDRDVIAESPAERVKRPTAEKSRERVLTDEEVRLFWKATAGLGYPFGPMFRLLLVTGARREEVAGMTRHELDLEGAEPSWTIPAARVKNAEEHHVPLCKLAVDILAEVPTIGKKGFVFTTTGDTSVSGFSRSKDRLDVAIGKLRAEEAREAGRDAPEPLPAFTLHDLRRTMASRMAKLGIAIPVVEKCLNHSSGTFGGIVGVYQHHDFAVEKRSAFDAWARYLEGLTADVPALNVRALRRVAA